MIIKRYIIPPARFGKMCTRVQSSQSEKIACQFNIIVGAGVKFNFSLFDVFKYTSTSRLFVLDKRLMIL